MLCEAGVEGARDSDWKDLQPATAADGAKALAVFTRFAEEPVEGIDPEGGDVGASYGAYNWHQGQGELFQLGVARGYVFLDEDGEYSHSGMLHPEFLYTPTPDLLALGRGRVDVDAVGADLGPLHEFLANVLATPAFQIADEPIGMRVWYIDYEIDCALDPGAFLRGTFTWHAGDETAPARWMVPSWPAVEPTPLPARTASVTFTHESATRSVWDAQAGDRITLDTSGGGLNVHAVPGSSGQPLALVFYTPPTTGGVKRACMRTRAASRTRTAPRLTPRWRSSWTAWS